MSHDKSSVNDPVRLPEGEIAVNLISTTRTSGTEGDR